MSYRDAEAAALERIRRLEAELEGEHGEGLDALDAEIAALGARRDELEAAEGPAMTRVDTPLPAKVALGVGLVVSGVAWFVPPVVLLFPLVLVATCAIAGGVVFARRYRGARRLPPR